MEEINQILADQRKEASGARRANLVWFAKNKQYLVHLYRGYYLVIRDCSVVGMFKDETEARRWASEKFYDGKTSIQLCVPGPTSYLLEL